MIISDTGGVPDKILAVDEWGGGRRNEVEIDDGWCSA